MPRVEQVQQKALEEFRERNKRNVRRKTNKNKIQMGEFAITFVCLFFILSLILLQIAKKVMPNVDMSVGNNTNGEVTEKDDTKRGIDDRLKLIQFNDKMVSGEIQRQQENDIFNKDLEFPVIIPVHKANTQTEKEIAPPENGLNNDVREIIARQQEQKEESQKVIAPVPANSQQTAQTSAPVPEEKYVLKPATTQSKEDLDKRIEAIQSSNVVINSPTNYKVFVGSYQTSEQAQLAKSILKDTAQGRNAFVKFVNGVYTLQVGSYTTKEQADSVARELSAGNFPARVYYEKP